MKKIINNPSDFAMKLPGFLMWATWQIIAFHKVENNLILHYHDLDTLMGGVFTSKLLDVPLIYDCHENYPGLVEGRINNRLVRGLHKLESRLLKHCRGIIAPTPADYARLKNMIDLGTHAPLSGTEEEAWEVMNIPPRKFLNTRITLIGNVKRLEKYPLEIIENKKNNSTFQILYIGVLEKHPSRGIIEAIITISKMKGVELNIGGFGTLVPKLKMLVEKIKNVNYIGAVNPEDIPTKTMKCDAVLMALNPSNINNKFSAPNKMFEAMAAGVPMITCKELLMGKFVEREEIGLTFEWGKWTRLRAVITKMMFDMQLCTNMGKRARRLAEKKYNWEKCDERLKTLLRLVKKQKNDK